jgi:MFS family permease
MTKRNPKSARPRNAVPDVIRHPSHIQVLPAIPDRTTSGLSPSQVRQGMRMSIGDGVFAQMFIGVTTGSFVTALAIFLGATDFVLGLITALPVLAQLVQLPAAWMVERRGDRRAIAVWSSLGRLFWLVPVVVLFIPMPTEWRIGLAVLAMALAFGLLAISTNAWLSWMSDLIPASLRGRFFGTRSTVLALVGLGVSFVGGTVLDLTRRGGNPALGFLILYGVACAAGLVSTYFVSRQPEPKLTRAGRGNFLALIGAPWRDRSFRSFMVTMSIWSFGINLGAPFFSAQSLKELHVSYQQLASFDMVLAAVSLVTQSFWGRLSDRVGQQRVIRWAMLGACPLSLTWLFVTPNNLWLLYLNNVVSGTFWPGFNLALNNRLMERAPAAGRAGYLALYSAITGGVAFVASLFGGVLANALAGGQYPLGPLVMNHYQVIFLLAGIVRVGTALFRRGTL